MIYLLYCVGFIIVFMFFFFLFLDNYNTFSNNKRRKKEKDKIEQDNLKKRLDNIRRDIDDLYTKQYIINEDLVFLKNLECDKIIKKIVDRMPENTKIILLKDNQYRNFFVTYDKRNNNNISSYVSFDVSYYSGDNDVYFCDGLRIKGCPVFFTSEIENDMEFLINE